MPPEEGEPTTPATTTPAATGVDIAASLATAPDAATDTPPATDVTKTAEYQALQEQNRALARQAGTSKAEADRLRQQEADRQAAAEANAIAQVQQQMNEALGDKASDFAEYARLLQTDPVAAAQKYAEMTTVQSPVLEATPTPAEPQEAPVTQQQTPRAPQPPAHGVSATTPLGQTQQQSRDDLTAHLDKSVEDVVVANQGLSTRARVTDRIRATAMGQFIQSAYIREMGGEEPPELNLNQRRR